MINHLKIKILRIVLATVLGISFSITIQAQTIPTVTRLIDSTCYLSISLVDSVNNIVSDNPPYLFSVAGIHVNSNSVGTANIDLSNVTNGTYPITCRDGSFNTYTDSITVTCGLSPVAPLPFGLILNDSNSINCSQCSGYAFVALANQNGTLHTFQWSDNFTFTDSIQSQRFGLCAGLYNVLVTNTVTGQSVSASIHVGCDGAPAPQNALCKQMLILDVGQTGTVSATPQDLSSSILNPSNLTQSYIVDDLGGIHNSYTYDCSDLGYHPVTLLLIDSTTQIADTCNTTIQVVDSAGICNGQSWLNYSINSTKTNATTCNTCDGLYFFGSVTDTINNYTYSGPFTYLWSDGATAGPTRAGLCPTQVYSVTAYDTLGHAFTETFMLGCNSPVGMTCLDSSKIDSALLCTNVYAPVCGCDSVTYLNDCVAQYKHGITSWTYGACGYNNISLSFSSTPSNACDSLGSCSGFAVAQASGGTGNYTYNWSNGTFGATANNLCPGNYTVTVMDGSGNSIVGIVTIGISGCVWPGDTDDNTVANNFDLLPIALAYNDTGNNRALGGIAWQPYTAVNWSNNLIPGLPNHKHIDCDGSGFIDSSDVFAIVQNYGQSYFRSTSTSLYGPIPFQIQSGTANFGDTLTLPILLGNQTFQANNAYAVAFTINYDPTLIEPGSITADFTTSWLGNDLIEIQKDFSNNGRLEVAIGRKDKTPVTGSGQIGAVSFTIKDDVWIGKINHTDSTLIATFGITDVRLIDENNMELGTNFQTSMVIISEDTYINKINNHLDIKLFPNPTRDLLYISSGHAQIKSIQLFNALGQLVNEFEANNPHQESVPTENLDAGVYFISIQTNKGIYNNKLQVIR